MIVHLFLQFELAFITFLSRRFLRPDLDSQLFRGQGIPEEPRRLHLIHANRRKRVIPGSHVLDDRVGLEDMGSNIMSVRAICRPKGSTVKEANRPSLRGLRRQVAEEGTESRVDLF